MAGRFITFEGGEGAGKSTQIARLAGRLERAGQKVTTTREPGGTPTAEAIRRALLSGIASRFGPDGEAVLFAAARADHVDRVIRPALKAGNWVLCDRFTDSTRVYQGLAGGVDAETLARLERVAVGGTMPELTIVLDLPVDIGLKRAARRMAKTDEAPDRFERDDLAMHERRRQGFLRIAKAEPDRCVVIDASGDENEVAGHVWEAVNERLAMPAANAR